MSVSGLQVRKWAKAIAALSDANIQTSRVDGEFKQQKCQELIVSQNHKTKMHHVVKQTDHEINILNYHVGKIPK